MKNRIRFKKHLFTAVIISLIMTALLVVSAFAGYRAYNGNYNAKLGAVIAALREKYPDISDDEIIGILNSADKDSDDLFRKYGIDPGKDEILIENKKSLASFLGLTAVLSLVLSALLIASFFLYDKCREKEIGEITRLIEKINKRNYELGIDSVSEDELSILRSEIYKTTVMLREAADNSLKDKTDLKNSFEDISHQLKTPLTSILIMLDAIIDDPDMDSETRLDFLHEIKRNSVSINFLVQAILKLSRFDSNTVAFSESENKLSDIVSDSVKNISAICDLRNITISISGDAEAKINCDARWQVEAVTNILKNCVEHSPDGGNIDIEIGKNSVYSMIKISDNGKGISEKDLPHIFERFYKGENPGPDSIGIGLALSKTIVEKDGGTISVSSSPAGTTFTIKYFTF